MKMSLLLELSRTRRRLLRAPGFSLSVIALIALSIGGVAAVATAGWSLFGKPLPYPQAANLVALSAFSERFGIHMGLSEALVEELDLAEDIGRVGIIGQKFDLTLKDGRRLRAAYIDHRLVDVFGLAPIVGRAFTDNDVLPGAERVALISAHTWREQFGADNDLTGRVIELEDSRVRVVGVMPDEFAIPESGTRIWLPMELGPDKTGPQAVGQLGSQTVIARTGSGFTPTQLEQRLRGRLGSDERLQQMRHMLEVEYHVRPLRELWTSGQRQGLVILGSATLVVLLAAWLNLAGLWLARWTGRDHELAIQSALGAARGQLLVGICLEYLLLAIPGGLLALLIAALGLDAFYTLGVLEGNVPLHATVSVPTWLAAFGLLVSGLVPIVATIAWQTRRIAGNESRFVGGRGLGARGNGTGLRKQLMIGQIGIAFSLLATLGLLLASWMNLLDQELGFEKQRLIAASITPPESGPSVADAGVAAVVERLRALPGIEAVSWTDVVPFGRVETLSSIKLEDGSDEPVPARPRLAGEEFFRTAGIELLSGRDFGPEDAGEVAKTAIVDKAFADRYMGGDALGRRFGLAVGSDSYRDLLIVGVVGSVRHMSPDEQDDNPTLYTYSREPGSGVQLLIRASIAPDAMVNDVRAVIEQEVDPQRVDFVSSLESLVRRTVRDREPQLVLMSAFAGLALVLVFYGLYALQSYQVAAGTGEIGLRKAMGASDRAVVGRILGRSAWMLPPGLALGVVGGWLGTRLVAERLYLGTLSDPTSWLGSAVGIEVTIEVTIVVTIVVTVVVLIAVTVLLASLVPALRASRVEPLEALRHE